jgi:2,3-dihydroxybiphenyl 1,2-dioxygenase
MSDLKSLGYITVSTSDIDRWRHFAFRVLGFAEGSPPKEKSSDPSALYLRMDERAARIVVVPGETDRVLAVGWEVRDHAALQRIKATLDNAGVAFKQLSVDDAEARRVEEVLTFEDPAGTTLEVFHGPVLDHSPVITPFGAKFVTGDQGLGHIVLPATDPGGVFDFYTEVLGFRSRGAFRVPMPKEFGPVRVRFLGINERHHSLAICPAAHQRDPGVVHIMVEVDTLDAVGQALDRINAEGVQLSSTLGRHTNDKMVSFYVRAPGDWDLEFGTDGMRVDETYYTAEEITADSYWGHQWVGDLPAAMRL